MSTEQISYDTTPAVEEVTAEPVDGATQLLLKVVARTQGVPPPCKFFVQAMSGGASILAKPVSAPPGPDGQVLFTLNVSQWAHANPASTLTIVVQPDPNGPFAHAPSGQTNWSSP